MYVMLTVNIVQGVPAMRQSAAALGQLKLW